MPTKVLNLNFKPRDWQQDCIDKQTRFTVLACHRRSGKSNLAAFELCSAAFSEPGNYAYVSPQKNQSKTNVWDVFKNILKEFIGQKADLEGKVEIVWFKESDITIRFYNGSIIYFLGGEDPDKIRGVKLHGVVVDEVAQTPKELWTEILRPALMDTKGWALFIGTPKGINLFSELFYRGEDPRYQPDWSSRKYDCYSTGALSTEEITAYRQESDENTFRREMMCDFTASADNQLMCLDDVNAAMNRDYDDRVYSNTLPLIMGVDVARMGADKSVIFFRRGLIAEDPLTAEKMPLTDLASWIYKHYEDRRPLYVIVDGTGVGGGVVDILTSMQVPVLDINFTSKANDSTYANKRTEMWCNMATWIRTGGYLPNDVNLKQELCAPLYEVDESGRKILEPKKKMRDRLGWSPDLADALALTFAQKFDTPMRLDYVEELERQYGIEFDNSEDRQLTRFKNLARGSYVLSRQHRQFSTFRRGMGRYK